MADTQKHRSSMLLLTYQMPQSSSSFTDTSESSKTLANNNCVGICCKSSARHAWVHSIYTESILICLLGKRLTEKTSVALQHTHSKNLVFH